MKKRYLVFGNGRVFEGYAFGADIAAPRTGETVFTTACGAYIETLTDPAFYGQIIVQTFPMIGNYGIISEDFESPRCHATGYVVREKCDKPSNFRCEGTVDEFLKEQGIPGIYGADTREITKFITANGAMNAAITDDPLSVSADEINAFRVKDAVKSVSRTAPSFFPATSERRYAVSMLDCGEKQSVIRILQSHGCDVTAFPYDAKPSDIMHDADGILLSGGPGDPSECESTTDTIRELIGKKPIMAFGLGHQLLALAAGAKTEKLPFGHRGANQPVRNTADGRLFITSQNHGYTVVASSLEGTAGTVSLINNNDKSVEGIDYGGIEAFSVQFSPDADSYLFGRFTDMMNSHKQKGQK